MQTSIGQTSRQLMITVLPLLGGVIVASMIIAVVLRLEGSSVREVWDAMYGGAWGESEESIDVLIFSVPLSSGRVRVLNFWMPLVLCSTGLLLTFSAGLWNIGIEGQLTMGAVGASMGALYFQHDSRTIQLLVEFGLAAALGGAWGLLAGILKTRGGVNEIFGGVALNFIAALFSAFLIGGPWAPEKAGTGSRTAPFEEYALMPGHEVYLRLSPLALYIGLGAFVLVTLALSYTRFGLYLKAIGKSAASARALGIAAERNIWLAMALCGSLAGLAGALRVLHITIRSLQANASGGIGFLALLVVLLASVRPWLTLIVSFVFSFLTTGALRVESALRIDSSLVQVGQGILVLAVLLFDGFRQKIQAEQERRAVAAEAARQAQEAEQEQAAEGNTS